MVKLMDIESQVWAAEADYFNALMMQRTEVLDQLLHPDFTLIDLAGSVITRVELIGSIAWGNLSFETIEPVESTIRFFGQVAVVTGETRVSGQFGGTAFAANSRYTHVFLEHDGRHQLVSVQGTPIVS
jgi:Domain of unknown function (DUF4440)